jgi:trehalose 6-phosphate synthase/phosphatase
MQNKMDKDTMSIVEDIQNNYPGALLFVFRNLSKIERLALWSMSNILLITSLRDGQCIPPLEFISVKKAEKKFDKSNVIMSQFSGCNSALGGILMINPYNIEDITKNIDIAMQMLPEEREQRLELAYSFI